MTPRIALWSLLVTLMTSPALAQTYVIRNARIVTVSGPTIQNGQILIQDGKIAAVGPNISIPRNAKVIDAKGLTAYPGMIDPFSEIGLAEIDSIAATQDITELGDLNAHLKVATSIDPNSEHISVSRTNGVTTVVSAPRGGLFGGQAAVINLDGWVTGDMLVKDSAALIINYPREVQLQANATSQQRQNAENTRKTRVELLRKTLRDAQAFSKLLDANVAAENNPALQALVPAVKGATPVMITAITAQEIREALELAEEFKLKPILVGANEAWKVVDFIKSKNAPVILGGVFSLPRKEDDPYDANYATAAALAKAGVKFAFTTMDSAHVRDLPFIAGMAGAFGLSKEDALKGVTLYAAEILNLQSQLGSISEGKVANIILSEGDPLETLTKIKHVFIAGKPVDLTNRQIELYEKYSNRP
jgi:imidazolonepropionase-like amidohydrolase